MTNPKQPTSSVERLAAALKESYFAPNERFLPEYGPMMDRLAASTLKADPTIAADLDAAPALRAENERLREALCNCGGPSQGAEPSGHADWCRLAALDRHEAGK